MGIQFDTMRGEKIEKIEVPQFDDNSMYDIMEFITNFEHLGTGMTFEKTLDFFRKACVLPKKVIEEYIKINAEKIYESYLIRLRPYQEGWSDERIDYIEEWMSDFKLESEEEKLKLIESIFYSKEDRDLDYNYFSIYISRLKSKGLTYLALLQFIANNSQTDQIDKNWESLLTELDITYDGTTMLGSDIRRVLNALFSSQSSLTTKLAVANNLTTYNSSYLRTDTARIETKFNEEYDNCVIYPSKNIISTLMWSQDEPFNDDTSIAMTERQLDEELGERAKDKKYGKPHQLSSFWGK